MSTLRTNRGDTLYMGIERERPQETGVTEYQGRPISLKDELSLWNKEKLSQSSNPALRLWAAMDDVDTSNIKFYGDKGSKDTSWKVKWAFYAIAHKEMEEKDVTG